MIRAISLACVLASTADAETCIGFDAALQRAAERSPEVSIARADRDYATAEVDLARSLSRPQISAFARTATGDQGLTDNFIENQIGLRISQRIYDFGDSRLARLAAQSKLDASLAGLYDEQQSAAHQLAQILVDESELNEQQAAFLERKRFLDTLLSTTQGVLEAGGATRSDVLEISTNLETLRAELIAIEYRLARSRVQIGSQLDHATCVEGDALISLGRVPDAVTELEQTPPLQNEAFQIEQRRQEIAALTAELERAKRNRLPVLEAVGVMSYSQDTSDQWAYRDRVGIDVSIPLYAGQRLTSDRAIASAQLGRAQGELSRLRRDYEDAVTLSRQRIVSLASSLLRQQRAVAHKTEQFDVATLEFEAGYMVLPDYIEHGFDLTDIVLAELTTRHSLMRERLTLRLLENRILQSQTFDHAARPRAPH